MVITLDIRDNTGLATPKEVTVDVIDLKASDSEMHFAADLTSAVKDFATNYNSPQKNEQGGVK